MVHTFENFKHSYLKGGKPIFAPSAKGVEWGEKVKRKVAELYEFEKFIYHFQDGSHVKALHSHRKNSFFCRVDIERFFYCIQRNRVKRALKTIGVHKAEAFAKWSTVKNPYPEGGYVLPYGFIQSPILATLVLTTSAVGNYLRSLNPAIITVSVYMDDICLSSQDEAALWVAFDDLKTTMDAAGFSLNADKTREPASSIDIFNCSLEKANSDVLENRIEEFYAVERSEESIAAFETYVDIVKSHTWRSTRKKKRKPYARAARKKAASSVS
ncbi:reverse transcriptase domain-containing protein [Ahrensia kielensis]|uniref:reverse transcriptase domain-containing protein n=1 Tax=Ahrensia kielensis TaxID=76980 RepID=UPI00319E980D